MIVIFAYLAGLVAIYLWHLRSWRKWDAATSSEDNSLAGAMKRSGGAE